METHHVRLVSFQVYKHKQVTEPVRKQAVSVEWQVQSQRDLLEILGMLKEVCLNSSGSAGNLQAMHHIVGLPVCSCGVPVSAHVKAHVDGHTDTHTSHYT